MRAALATVGVAALCALLSACVTVNVYFPAAAAERVADRIVKEVYGIDSAAPAQPAPEGGGETPKRPPPPLPAPSVESPPTSALERAMGLLVREAHAQEPDIEVSSPAIEALKASMRARHARLVPYYDSGAIGMAASGLLVLRDPQAVPLKDRQALAGVIAAENRDRNALYREIAQANDHPEWEDEIRTIFDRRWVANAPSGWFFEDVRGNWMRK